MQVVFKEDINQWISNCYLEKDWLKGGVQLNSKLEELTLLLLYLTAWEEEARPLGVYKRSAKGFSSRVLDKLDADGLLVGSDKSSSVFLTHAGATRAQALARKYLGEREFQLLSEERSN